MASIRLSVSFFLSVLTTITLFWFLGVLVSPVVNFDVIPVVPGIDFTTHIPETEPIHIIRVPPPIPKPQLSEVSTIVIEPNVVRPGHDPKGLAPQTFGPGELGVPPGEGSKISHAGGSDRAPVPQVRIEPDYPHQARDRGIEGWVTFSFTVAVDGSVKDVAILASEPPRIWDAATIRAVTTWKYQPAIQDGRPVEQVDVRATYRFELER